MYLISRRSCKFTDLTKALLVLSVSYQGNSVIQFTKRVIMLKRAPSLILIMLSQDWKGLALTSMIQHLFISGMIKKLKLRTSIIHNNCTWR